MTGITDHCPKHTQLKGPDITLITAHIPLFDIAPTLSSCRNHKRQLQREIGGNNQPSLNCDIESFTSYLVYGYLSKSHC